MPEYMIPAAFVCVEELPLLANGKVDRTRLPAPDALPHHRTQDYVEPRNEMERSLAAIFAEVLGVERVGIYDNFFSSADTRCSPRKLSLGYGKNSGWICQCSNSFKMPTVAGLAEATTDTQGSGMRKATALPSVGLRNPPRNCC